MPIGFGDWWYKRMLLTIYWFPLVEISPKENPFPFGVMNLMKMKTELQQHTFTQRPRDEEVGVGLTNQLVSPKKMRPLRNCVRIIRERPMLMWRELGRPFLGESYNLPGTRVLPLFTPFMVWCFLFCWVVFIFLAFMGEKRNQISSKASWPYYGSRILFLKLPICLHNEPCNNLIDLKVQTAKETHIMK